MGRNTRANNREKRFMGVDPYRWRTLENTPNDTQFSGKYLGGGMGGCREHGKRQTQRHGGHGGTQRKILWMERSKAKAAYPNQNRKKALAFVFAFSIPIFMLFSVALCVLRASVFVFLLPSAFLLFCGCGMSGFFLYWCV